MDQGAPVARSRSVYDAHHHRITHDADTTGNGAIDTRREVYYDESWRAVQVLLRAYDTGTSSWADPHEQEDLFWGARGPNDLVHRTVLDIDDPEEPVRTKERWVITDLQFSVMAVVDQAGAIVERVSYGPYGDPRHHPHADLNGDGAVTFADSLLLQGNWGNPGLGDLNQDGTVDFSDQLILTGSYASALPRGLGLSTDGNVIGFTGHVFDAETGLLLARLRVHDAVVLGRWLSRDPAGFVDGMNLYVYVRGNPLVWWDPLGMWSLSGWIQEASYFIRGMGMVVSDAIQDRVSAICDDPAGFLESFTLRAQGEAIGKDLIARWERARKITEQDAALFIAPDTTWSFVLNLGAELTPAGRAAEGLAGFDRDSQDVIDDSLVRAGMVSSAVGESLSMVAGGSGVAGQASRMTRKSVPTPHGTAIQANTPAAHAALRDVRSGETVYRQGSFGVQNTADAQFWSLQNPASTMDFASQMGMFGGASRPDWIMGGQVSRRSAVVTRPAPRIGSNVGGNMEAVVPPGGVQILWFHMPD